MGVRGRIFELCVDVHTEAWPGIGAQINDILHRPEQTMGVLGASLGNVQMQAVT